MKKLLAMALAVMLLLTTGVAMAATTPTSEWKSDANSFTFTKTYTVNAEDTTKYPQETLTFTVAADAGNPDAAKLITVEADNSFGVTGLTNTITVNTPVYEKVGLYKYTINEVAGDTQGVTYDTKDISVLVLVTYNNAEEKLDVECGVEADATGNKQDKIENVYTFGGNEKDGSASLKVTKKVTGNLGDVDKYFDIDVTLTAKNYVRSVIDIKGGSNEENPTSIPAGWTGEKTVTISLKDGETVQFDYIPEGVTYVVAEQEKHHKAEDQNDPNSEEGYTVTYEKENGEVKQGESPEAVVTNDKRVEIHTGVTLEVLPYVFVMALVALGFVMMFARRRRDSER